LVNLCYNYNHIPPVKEFAQCFSGPARTVEKK
jgi:hypothetical protein